VPFKHRVEFLVFRAARALLRLLPESLSLGIGSGLGWLIGSALRIRRRVVDENLARAFPDRDPRWRREVALASYRHLGREAVATFRLAGRAALVKERTEVHGMEALERARAEGRGVIIVTGHLGNWEIGGAALAVRGVPLDAVALPQKNRLFDRELTENRTRSGVTLIPKREASRGVLDSVANGRVPALVADQNAGRRGLFVDFFGVPASTARGAALFSLRSGARLFLAVSVARPGRPHRYDCHLEEVTIEPTGNTGDDACRLTQAHTASLERWVRQEPAQYFWQHKRWKTRPPPPVPAGGTVDPGDGYNPK